MECREVRWSRRKRANKKEREGEGAKVLAVALKAITQYVDQAYCVFAVNSLSPALQ